MYEEAKAILKKHWGYNAFRPDQEQIILAALRGEDVLGLLPTGGGKSICFQVPAMVKKGICIVVSPLIALMNDQIKRLKSINIKAEMVSGNMTPKQMDYALDNCVFGNTKFLYLSPERLQSVFVQERVKQMNVNFIAIDEAHCISQWGHDFRPSYRKISLLRQLIPSVPVIALTATATKKVGNDIQLQLDFKKRNVFKSSFKRPNIQFSAENVENKNLAITNFLKVNDGCSIVYIRSRKKSEELAAYLQNQGISADYYHAGIAYDDKRDLEEDWNADKLRVIVATNAFGMGIDKPDVRNVLHYGLPSSLEEYYQEAGRAGRDGEPARAKLFFNRNDFSTAQMMLNYQFPKRSIIQNVYQSIANKAQIAVGAGVNEGTGIELKTFAEKLNTHPLLCHNSINILERCGYIFTSENIGATSKVQITQRRNEVESVIQSNKLEGKLLSVLLRSYTSIFNTPVSISESKIASILEVSVSAVKKTLQNLEKTYILTYQEKAFLPSVFFTVPRVSNKYLKIGRDVLEERQEQAQLQLNSIINYASNCGNCRTNYALFYFDESPKSKCDTCDICIEKSKSIAPSEYIIDLLKNGELSLVEIVLASNLDKTTTVEIIRTLLDRNILARNGDKIMLTKKAK